MEIEQRMYQKGKWSSEKLSREYILVLAFISPDFIGKIKISDSLNWFYPDANIVFISTAWEIMWDQVYDDTISVTAIKFEKTSVQVALWKVDNIEDSSSVASKLAKDLYAEDLNHVLVFSDWVWVNGSEIVRWIKRILPKKIKVTWWMAWDGDSMENTYVWLNTLSSQDNNIIMIWLYWDSLKVWSCSLGWWQKFGEKKTVTKSIWNVVYEFDGEPALDFYKKYLLQREQWLIEAWTHFSIWIFEKDENDSVVRSFLSSDEYDKSIAFFWDVPEGYKAYLTRADNKLLIKWAEKATEYAHKENPNPELALLVNCVWRKWVLKEKIKEEIEVVSEMLWKDCKIAGFHSYGEIWVNKTKDSDYFLHNQTMTVTLLSEE